ncbi:MAG: tetratricopeptide repeat protein [Bacteroidia bacterium]|nr:tetratricopeptide repeat protein [Bacteroidia bacterium]
MKKLLIFAAVIKLCLSGIIAAPTPESLFSQANEVYAREDFEGAVRLYDSVLNQGFESDILYFNLGNAHYKLQHTALAVLNYERALKINPGMEDAQVNLQLANLRVKDNIKPIPGFALTERFRNLIYSFSSGQWAWIAIIFLWLAMIMGAGFLFLAAPTLKRITFFSGIVLVIFSLSAFLTSLSRNKSEKSSSNGIILSQNVYVKNAPSGNTDLLILHEGIKVSLVEQIGGWTKIRVADVNIGTVEGFIENKNIAPI